MPWKPGQSGNPRGRPPARENLTAAIRAAARHKLPDGTSYRHALADKLWTLAIAGNLQAARLILEYLVGRPSQARGDGAVAGSVLINLIAPSAPPALTIPPSRPKGSQDADDRAAPVLESGPVHLHAHQV